MAVEEEASTGGTNVDAGVGSRGNGDGGENKRLPSNNLDGPSKDTSSDECPDSTNQGSVMSVNSADGVDRNIPERKLEEGP